MRNRNRQIFTIARNFSYIWYSDSISIICREQFSYNTSNVELIECKDVLVNHQGFVYNGYFEINKKSLLSPNHHKGYFNLKHFVKKSCLKRKEQPIIISNIC